MICPQCDHRNPVGSSECARCGATIVGEQTDSSGADTVVGPVTDRPKRGPDDNTLAAPGTEGWSAAATLHGTPLGHGPLPEGYELAGRYSIVKLLGEGGMGAVFQARDIELDRFVAVKVIRPELASNATILKRFKQELIFAREVTHPNVVRIFDLGTAGSIKFITMEFVEGRDLKSLILEGHKFSTEETVAIFSQICQALKAAHDAGIVHRDLKPQNVMLDTEGRAKVMDFGVARSMDMTGITGTGQLIGTPDYMSPEQARGEKSDTRSDLFSLGIILYEMLVGGIPYEADTMVGALLKRTQEPAPPPVKQVATVPDFLNDITVRCLQIEPELRYQNAQEILDDLEAQQASGLPSWLAQLRYRMRRSRMAATLAALAAVAVLIAATAIVVNGIRAPGPAAPGVAEAVEAIEPVSLAILPFRNATGDPAIDWLQSSLADMLRSDIGQSARLRTVPSDRVHQIVSDLKVDPAASPDPATIRRLADHSNAGMVMSGQYSKLGDMIRIDATLHDLEGQRSIPLKTEAKNEAELLTAIGELAQSVRSNMDLSSDAIRELEATAFAPSTESIEALRHYNEGLQFERQGNYIEALAALEESVEADQDFALAHAKLGNIYVNLGRDGDAEQASRTAVELSEALPDFEKYLIAANHAMILNDYDQAIAAYERLAEAAPEDPQISFNLADLYEQTGDFDRARERLDKVLGNDPNYVDALYASGRVAIRSGNPQDALTPLNSALTLTVQSGNEEGRGRMLHAIGIAYKHMGQLDEALRNYEASLAIRRELGQKSGIAAGLGEIASVHQSRGDLDDARSNLEEALEIRREIGDRAGIGSSLLGLGDFHFTLGNYDDALEQYKGSLRIYRELGDERSEALCLNNIGGVYLDRGDYGDAMTNLEQSLRLREKTNIAYELGETLFNLGETASALGRYDQALDYYLRGLEQMRLAQDDRVIAAAQHGIAVIHGHQGRFRASLESLEEAVDTLKKSGDEGYWHVIVSARHGAALGAVGRFDESRTALDEATVLAEGLQNHALLAQVRIFQGENDLYQRQPEQAATRFEAALSEAEVAGDRRAALIARLDLARTALAAGRAAEATDALETVRKQAGDLGLKYIVTESSVYLGQALLEQGDAAGARDRLNGALTELERSELRPLLAKCRQLLGRIERADGNASGAARHYDRVRGLLKEIREEAGDEDPFRRQDLQSILVEAGAATGNQG
jgi:tetratricopeptide (TPR) repeat protein